MTFDLANNPIVEAADDIALLRHDLITMIKRLYFIVPHDKVDTIRAFVQYFTSVGFLNSIVSVVKR